MPRNSYPLPTFQQETGQCYDLPAEVVDKYFGCNVAREPLKAQVAKAICARCPILEECRTDALNNPQKGLNGIVAGLPRHQIDVGRHWLGYELGIRDTAPRGERPDWLPRSEAAEAVEQMRSEEELGVER